MTIRKLLSKETPPLRPDDTAEHALALLMEFGVQHLPVVGERGELAGLLSEDRLLEAAGPEATVASLLGAQPVRVGPDMHVFDVTKVMVEHGLTTVPVADDDTHYLGLVRRDDIFNQFARMLSTQEPGAILALEVDPRDYSLAKLVYTIEQNDVKILSIASEAADAEEGRIRVTLKLNVTDASRVRHMLEHYGYRVIASFSDVDDDEELQMRVMEFMRYLEV